MGETNEPKEFIREILSSQFGRDIKDIKEISQKNHPIYRLSLQPHNGAKNLLATGRPGTEPLPPTTTEVILHFTNPGAALNDAVVVQNQVAAATILRSALGDLIPKVYGWKPATVGGEEKSDDFSGRGWVLQESLPGVALGSTTGEGEKTLFGSLDSKGKKIVLDQLAHIFQRIQTLEFPASVKGYGGLTFAQDGSVITGATAIRGATKSCSTYYELYIEYLKTQLASMDMCDIIQGWKDSDNLRARIDKFVTEGFQAKLADAIEANPKPTLVHGDLDLPNVLFDPESLQITALLDTEFSHIGSANDEYFMSFAGLQSHFPPPHHPVHQALRDFLLHGTVPAASELSEHDDFQPDLAKQVRDAFSDAGVTKPSDLKSIDKLSILHYFIQNISPGLFFVESVRRKLNNDRATMIKKMIYADLDKTLADWGY